MSGTKSTEELTMNHIKYQKVYRPSFTTEYEMWKRFVRCTRDNETTATDIINKVMKDYLKENEKE
jgi:hypothetical protein